MELTTSETAVAPCQRDGSEARAFRPLDVPERWLGHQQFLFGATLLAQRPRAGREQQDNLFRLLHPSRIAPTGAALAKYNAELQTMPPSVLELLCSLEGGQIDCWADHQPIWHEALARLRWNDSLNRSFLAGAKLLASRLSCGTFEGPQICRIAATELEARWDRIEGLADRLERLRDWLVHSVSAYDRLDALRDFREGEGKLPLRWEMVENVLLQQAFAWPLLVTPSQTSCALPAIVQVELGLEDMAAPVAEIVDGPNTDGQQWRHSLGQARRAAVDLWLTKHSSEDFRFQKLVRKSRVTLDLRLTSDIVAPFYPDSPLKLSGGSLESYIGLDVLGQLLGQLGLGDVCATGELGDRVDNGTGSSREKKGHYWGLKRIARRPGEPHWIDEKVGCARRSFFFEKILVPEHSTPAGRRGHLQVVGVPVRVGRDSGFSGYATEALGQLWRRHHYVRSPDVALGFKDEKSPRDDPDRGLSERSARLLTVFMRTASAIVRPAGYSAADVAHALYWVNDDAQRDSNYSLEEFAGNERLGRFAFVRATPDELNERFWATIWEVCGGSAESYRRFVLALDRRAAALEVAALLNHVTATQEQRLGAPDALVIIGSNHLSPPRDSKPMESDPQSKFRLDTLVGELSSPGLLKPTANRVLRDHLGATRLILVTEDSAPWTPLARHPDPTLGRAFNRLSVFRHGFSYAMARAMLKVDDEECDRILDGLSGGGEHRPVLFYAENAQEAFLAYRAPLPERAEDYAALHFDAANSIAGILDRAQRPAHHDFDKGFRPDRLHEAQWHIEEANRAAKSTKKDMVRNRMSDARERLSRIGEPFSWSQLLWATRHSIQARDEMWLAMRRAMEEAGEDALHPIQLVRAAQFARKMQGVDPNGAAHYAAERSRFLDAALSACARLEGEESAGRFLVHSSRAWMIMKDRPDLDGYAAARSEIDAAWADHPNSVQILEPEWFEQCGDGIEDPGSAAEIYRKGFLNGRIAGAEGLRICAMVKWIGSLAAVGRDPDAETLHGIGCRITARDRSLIGENIGLKSGLRLHPAAGQRWVRGREALSGWRL